MLKIHIRYNVQKKTLQRVFLLALMLWFLSAESLWSQAITLPGGSKPKTVTPSTPKPSYKPSAPAAPTNKQVSVRVKLNISAKVNLNVEANGRTWNSSFVINGSESGTYQLQKIYVGDATLELILPDRKRYNFNEFLNIDPDIANMDIYLNNNGIVSVKTKTHTQIKEEKLQQEKEEREAKLRQEREEAENAVSGINTSVSGLTSYRFQSSGFLQGFSQLYVKNHISSKTKNQAEQLSADLTEFLNVYNRISGKSRESDFYSTVDNYILVSNARIRFKQAKTSYSVLANSWDSYTHSRMFLVRIKAFFDAVESNLNEFPADKESFQQKVKTTLENWAQIKAEEERQKRLLAEKLERERQERIRREREEAEARERQRRYEERLYKEWKNKSGAFLAGSLPLGGELGVLASDRLGNMFGLRYFTNDAEISKVQVHNCMTFPIAGPIQMGLTLAFGAQEVKDPNQPPAGNESKQEWDFGLGFGGRLMFVDYGFMGGLEYTFGSEAGGGVFFIAGIRIGDL